MRVMRSYCFAIAVLALSATGAGAQIPPPSELAVSPSFDGHAPAQRLIR